MDKSVSIVRKRAKKYKNWLEKISINTFPWVIEDNYYFLVSYLKSKKVQGVAVLSDVDILANDAKQAHKPLFLFYALMNHIYVTGQLRASIDLSYFNEPIELSRSTSSEEIEAGKALISSLLEKQIQFTEVFEEFFTHLSTKQKKKQPLYNEDIKLAIHTIAKLELLHYQIVKETAENFDVLKEWKNHMKEKELWDKLKQNKRVFYLQMIENEDKMMEELNNSPKAIHKNPEKMLKVTKEKYQHFMEDIRKKELQELRHP